jgi:LysM repeat protein
MNNPNNPFVPKGSLLDLQGRRRSQLKIAVFCVVAVGAVSLSAMLIQGCERKKPDETLGQETLGAGTNVAMTYETASNLPPVSAVSNAVAQMTPVVESNTTPILPPAGNELTQPGVGGGDYKIVKGDTLDKIAKHYGVSTKALEAANPKLDPKRLKIGDKVVIPAATPKAPSASSPGASAVGANVYVVKQGDSLGKIAKSHGTTVAALKAVNSLATDRINVGQHLTIPDKSVAAPAATALVPAMESTPPAPPVTSPAPVK